jgi:hypothetical protein
MAKRPFMQTANGAASRASPSGYRAHEKLMRAFLDEEVDDGRIRVEPEHGRADARQRSLIDD